jgi:hypothetical protein
MGRFGRGRIDGAARTLGAYLNCSLLTAAYLTHGPHIHRNRPEKELPDDVERLALRFVAGNVVS